MFGKKEEDLKLTTLIGEGAKLDGNFSVPGSTRIDGQIDGNVFVEGTLIVGASGKINGDVSTETLILGGEVQGNISASKRAELTNTAKVMGDIQTAVIVIDENAVFQGKCSVGSENPAGKTVETAAQETAAAQERTVTQETATVQETTVMQETATVQETNVAQETAAVQETIAAQETVTGITGE